MGTWLALHSMQGQVSADGDRFPARRHRVFYGFQVVFMLSLLAFYGSVIDILSSKVPLKSADYDIQWSTMDYQPGTAGSPPTLRFHMQIFNRHESLGLEVENANLLLNLEGRYLGEAGLNIPYVAPATSVVVPVELALKVDFYELAGIAAEELFSVFTGEEPAWRDKVQARLMVRLPLGLRLPLYISAGYRHEFQEGQ
jgi:hypothetical protein